MHGPLQRAHQLTFDAEILRAGNAGAGKAGDAGAGKAGDAAREASGQNATDAWRRAARAWDAVSEPYPASIALFRLAEAALAGREDRDAAADALRRAAEITSGLGAAPLHGQIRLLARRARIPLAHAGGRPSAGEARAPGQPAARPGDVTAGDVVAVGLTPREMDVLRLIADGRSNAGIAEDLFISVKTVSVHVSNILAKLGVSSRAEAAASAHRLRLLDTDSAA